MKNPGWILGLLLIAGLSFWIALPREEMGEVQLDTSCLTEVSTERRSTNTFFKTFTCYDHVGTRQCYYFKTENGVCVKLYRYWFNLDGSPTK